MVRSSQAVVQVSRDSISIEGTLESAHAAMRSSVDWLEAEPPRGLQFVVLGARVMLDAKAFQPASRDL